MTIKRRFLMPIGFILGVSSVLGFNHFQEEEKTPLTYESFKVQEVEEAGLYVAKNIKKGTDKEFLAFDASDVLNDEDVKIGDTVKAEYRTLKGEDKFIGVTDVKAGKQVKTANTSDIPYNDEYTFSSYKIEEVKENGYYATCYNNCVNNKALYFNKKYVMYNDSLKYGDYVNAVYDSSDNELLKVEKLVENGKGSYVMASYLKEGKR